jgi:hypothetical protein
MSASGRAWAGILVWAMDTRAASRGAAFFSPEDWPRAGPRPTIGRKFPHGRRASARSIPAAARGGPTRARARACQSWRSQLALIGFRGGGHRVRATGPAVRVPGGAFPRRPASRTSWKRPGWAGGSSREAPRRGRDLGRGSGREPSAVSAWAPQDPSPPSSRACSPRAWRTAPCLRLRSPGRASSRPSRAIAAPPRRGRRTPSGRRCRRAGPTHRAPPASDGGSTRAGVGGTGGPAGGPLLDRPARPPAPAGRPPRNPMRATTDKAKIRCESCHAARSAPR